jgi:hypothetical protein
MSSFGTICSSDNYVVGLDKEPMVDWLGTALDGQRKM